jgi:pimeloyl-ACP methyl ester carboxylesterase
MRHPATKALLLAIMLVSCALPASARADIAFTPCPQYPSLQCGSLDVPLDRSARLPGTIRLAAIRRTAPSNPAATALVALAGGPGQAATPLVRDFATVMLPALATRDLLVFDQRGTGASTALSCSLKGRSLTSAARRCAAQLGARRGQFTTAASVEDLEALRAAIGYDKLVLYGISYGTKVALEYTARYPSRVEALVLDSVVLPGGPDTLQRSTFQAIGRVLTELCAAGACANISGNPVADLNGQVRRLAEGPLKGRLTDANGRRRRAEIYRKDLLNILLTGDLNPTLRAELPGALTSARRGDASPLIRLAARSAGIIDLRSHESRQLAGEEFSDPVFAATICEEGLFPWNRAASRPTRAQQARAILRLVGDAPFFPFDAASSLTTDIIQLCIGWPTATTPPPPTPPLPDVPTLVVSGATDIRTPREDAEKVAGLIPRAQLVSLPYTGHSALAGDLSSNGCGLRATLQFFAGQTVAPCDASANPVPPTPVAPTRASRLHGTGSDDRIGRSITAALMTADDVRRQVIGDLLELGRFPKRDGGLRGGRVTIDASGRMRLRDVVYVPGVRISGSVPFATSGTRVLRIGGPRAARGRITVTPATISGRVGGRRISLDAAAAATTARDAIALPLARLAARVHLRHAG